MQGWIKIHRDLLDNELWSDKPFTKGQAYCRIIDGGDGLTVRSEALQDGINLNDEIKEILAKYCSEHVGDYFALCEKRWMVKQ